MTSGGKLATDAACCECGECPNCCSQISSGALVAGEIKFFDFVTDYSVDVTVTTPTGTRVVCNGDQITVTIVIESLTEVTPDLPFIKFDPAWKLISHSGDADSSSFPGGFVYWDNEDGTFTATLEYTNCYSDIHTEFGLIQLGTDSVTFDVETTRCLGSLCCNLNLDCTDCCWYMDRNLESGSLTDWVLVGTALRKIVVIDNYFICYEIETAINPGETCEESNEITIRTYVSARTAADLLGTTYGYEYNFPDNKWKYLSSTPEADTHPAIGDTGDISWTTTDDAPAVEAVVYWQCPDSPTPMELVTSIIPTVGSPINNAIEVDWLRCDDGECECCCPPSCCYECDFPVDADACDYLLEVGGVKDPTKSKTRLMTFVSTFTSPINEFCYDIVSMTFTSNTVTYTLQEPVYFDYSCYETCAESGFLRLCPHSSYSVSFWALDGCPTVGCDYYNTLYSWDVDTQEWVVEWSECSGQYGCEEAPIPPPPDNTSEWSQIMVPCSGEAETTGRLCLVLTYMGGGQWDIGYCGVPGRYVGWDFDLQSSDCNGGTVTFSFVSHGRTINVTTTFTLDRGGADDTRCEEES